MWHTYSSFVLLIFLFSSSSFSSSSSVFFLHVFVHFLLLHLLFCGISPQLSLLHYHDLQDSLMMTVVESGIMSFLLIQNAEIPSFLLRQFYLALVSRNEDQLCVRHFYRPFCDHGQLLTLSSIHGPDSGLSVSFSLSVSVCVCNCLSVFNNWLCSSSDAMSITGVL